jgi:hypothetical protein
MCLENECFANKASPNVIAPYFSDRFTSARQADNLTAQTFFRAPSCWRYIQEPCGDISRFTGFEIIGPDGASGRSVVRATAQ